MKTTQNQRIHLEDLHLKLWGDIVRLLKSKSLWYLKHYFIPEDAEGPELLISYMKNWLMYDNDNYGYDHCPPHNCFLCELSSVVIVDSVLHQLLSSPVGAIYRRQGGLHITECNRCQYFKIKCNEGDSLWRRLYYAVKSQNEPLTLKLATEIRDVVINKIG